MSTRKPKLNAQILEEAAEWFVEFEGEDADGANKMQREAFDEWLRRSPEHVRAFLELLPLWEQGAARREPPDVDSQHLIDRALNAKANVVPLSPLVKSAAPAPAPVRAVPEGVRAPRRLKPVTAIAASAVLAIGAAWLLEQHGTYSTRIGEQRSLTLPDGSIVELNARSRVRIRFAARERGIDLLEGQALFRVAHEKARPFVVYSADTKIRAVGTEFDVYRKASGTTITVLEGRVAVVAPESERRAGEITGTSAQRELAPLTLSAGQRTVVALQPATRADARTVTRVDPAVAIAWTQRRLMFQKTALAEVVDEFNRYNARPLRIDDPDIRAFLVSGTFASTDPASLLRFLREQPGIRVVETDTAIHIAAAP